jgi:hypothetical protein
MLLYVMAPNYVSSTSASGGEGKKKHDNLSARPHMPSSDFSIKPDPEHHLSALKFTH